MLLRNLRPIRLSRRIEPFDSDQFIFELKVDGFRALAHIEAGYGELISRKGTCFAVLRKSPPGLLDIFGKVRCSTASSPVWTRPAAYYFCDLLFRKRQCVFVAFDLPRKGLLLLTGHDCRVTQNSEAGHNSH